MNFTWLMCLWLTQGGISAYLAKRKGRNPFLWFAIGCFFGLFGILAIIFMKPLVRIPVFIPQPQAPRLPHFLWYYLDNAYKQHGPISSIALESALREGRISLSTLVWREEMAEWEQFEKICRDHGIPTDTLVNPA